MLSLPPEAAVDLARLPGAQSAQQGPDGRWTVLADDADRLVRALVVQDVPFRDLEMRGASLEEAFLALTSHEEEVAR